MLIWKAYLSYRKRGVAVPDEILVLLDKVASRLLTASSARDVARAVEMSTRGGGPAGSKRTRHSESRRDKIEHFERVLYVGRSLNPKFTQNDAFNEAAKDLGTTVGALKTLVYEARARKK